MIKCSSCLAEITPHEDEKTSMRYCPNCWNVFDFEDIDSSYESRGGVQLSGDSEIFIQRKQTSHQVSPDYSNKMLISTKNRVGKYLERINQRSKFTSSIPRNLLQAKEALEHYSTMIVIPKEVSVVVLENLKKILSKTLIRGRSLNSVMLGLICLAFRQVGSPRTTKEILKKITYSKKEIGRNISFISKVLNLRCGIISPHSFLKKYLFQFNFPPEAFEEGKEIIDNIQRHKANIGKGPLSVVSVVIYFLSKKYNVSVPLKTLLEEMKVTEITFKNRYSNLKDLLK